MQTPNIILIVGDTLRKDYSNNLDKLLDFNFYKVENAYAASPWTLPSHVSMFTGLLPYFHGVHEFFGIKHIASDFAELSTESLGKYDNLISMLKEENYKTIGISANWFITPVFGFNFDESYQVIFPPFLMFDNRYWNLTREYFSNYNSKRRYLSYLIKNKKFYEIKLLLKYGLSDNYFSRKIYFKFSNYLSKGCNLIIKKLQEISFDTKTFLFINVMEAHEPYSYKGLKKGINEYDYQFLKSVFFSSADDHVIKNYQEFYPIYAENSVNCIINIVSILRNKINFDNTLVIVTADHGNHIGENGRVYHGYYLSDELVKVPLYVKYPKSIKPEQRLQGRTISLTSIYHLVKSMLYNEIIPYNNVAITESYGPQYSMKTIKSFFNIDDSFIKKFYSHRIRISKGDAYVIYDLEKDEIIEATAKFPRELIDLIKNEFL